jgi:2-succinyl-6-hydroxy-2,4-cyclohexadiene-1-carboxylate synthase
VTVLQTEQGTVWVRRYGDSPPAVVALHGFTLHGGSFATFAAELGRTVLAPDLPGHGRTEIDRISVDSAVSAVIAVLTTVEAPPILLGYSQGGRIALQVAFARPELIGGLVLVSTSPGLSRTERRVRQVADDALAARIERIGTESFITEWLANPLTATDRARQDERDADLTIRLENTAAGLAGALRGFGQAAVPDSRDRLQHLAMRASFIAGGLDGRYVDLAREMAATSGNEVVIVPGAGHNVILDDPRAVASVVRGLLSRRTD